MDYEKLEQDSIRKMEELHRVGREFLNEKRRLLKIISEEFINPELSEVELDEIYKDIELDIDYLENNIIKSFDYLFSNIVNMQRTGLKKNISFINMSFLQTMLLEKKGVFLLEAFDENYFLDNDNINVILDLNCFYKYHFKAFDKVFQNSISHKEYITEDDIHNILIVTSIRYFKIIRNFMYGFIEKNIINLKSFKEMNKNNEIKFVIGLYRGISFEIINYEI